METKSVIRESCIAELEECKREVEEGSGRGKWNRYWRSKECMKKPHLLERDGVDNILNFY